MKDQSANMVASEDRWELGSEFSWSGPFVDTEDRLPWPGRPKLYATGRTALIELGRMLGNGRRRRLYLPSYFCATVTESLKPWFDLHFFTDIPEESGPRFEAIKARAGDMVLAVNFFGIRDGQGWSEYQKSHDDVIVVEDHTHDPLSAWAFNSRAGYAFASLRKTIPLPDGAVLWSPRGLDAPFPSGPTPRGSYLKLEAMLLKDAYLRGFRVEKDRFRYLQIEGEQNLEESSLGEACTATQLFLPLLPVSAFRRKREENIRSFLAAISGLRLPLTALYPYWPEGNVPLGAVLRCESEETRRKLLAHLVGNNVYASVHWPQAVSGAVSNNRERMLSQRILTLPMDHRYGPGDLERVITILKGF
jgi:hypothetical protein